MPYVSVSKVQGPFQQDNSQSLLYKICWVLWGVASGDFGFLVRGNVTSTSAKGATITRFGFTSGLTSSQTLLASNISRLSFFVDNRTGVDLYYRYGGGACSTAVGGYDVRIPAGTPAVVDDGYTGAVTFICDAGATATGVNVTEVAS